MLQSIGIDFKATGVQSVIGAIRQLEGAIRGMRGRTVGALGPAGEGIVGGPARGRARLRPGSFRGAGFFMARWFGIYKLAQLGAKSVTQLLLSGAREGIDEALGELEAVSFSQENKRQAEYAANQFIQRTWLVTHEEYLKSMSQAASALPVAAVGVETLARATESAAKMAKLSKMEVEPATEMLAQFFATMQDMPEFVGMTPGQAMERMAAITTKAVEKSMVWAPQLMHAFKYALPLFKQAGYSFSQAVGMIAALRDIGFHPGQLGRGWRYFMTKGEQPFAKLLLAGDPRGQMWETTKPGMKGAALKRLKARNAKRLQSAIQYVRERMVQDPIGFFEELAERTKRAWKLGLRPSDLGMSQRWLPIMMELRDGVLTRLREYVRQFSQATVAEMDRKIAEMQLAPGKALPALKASFESYLQTMAQHPYAWGIVGPIKRQLDMMSTVTSTIATARAAKKGQRLAEAAGMLVKHSDAMIKLFGPEGFEQVRDLVLQQMGLNRNIDEALMRQKILIRNMQDLWEGIGKAFDMDPEVVEFWKAGIPGSIKNIQQSIKSVTMLFQALAYLSSGEIMKGLGAMKGLLGKEFQWKREDVLFGALGKKGPTKRGYEIFPPSPTPPPIGPAQQPITPPTLEIKNVITGDIGGFLRVVSSAIWKMFSGDQPASQTPIGTPTNTPGLP